MSNGITLVALIITIIILIILAAVTIFAFRDSKLIEVAINGTTNYANAQKAEESIMTELSDRLDKELEKIEKAQGGNGGSAGGNEGPTEELKVAVSILTEKMKIEIGTTNVVGIKEFKYKVSPEAGIAEAEGKITPGEKVEVMATIEGSYTITITAIDNEGNEKEVKTETVQIINKLTVATAKRIINENNLREYLGEEVVYTPKVGGTWRVFYYDETGYFGKEKTLYLKKDYEPGDFESDAVGSSNPSDEAVNLFNKLNPCWTNNSVQEDMTIGHSYKKSVAYCEPNVWEDYRTSESQFVVGGPSVEMYIASVNVALEEESLGSKVVNRFGYAFTKNGKLPGNRRSPMA